MFTGMAARHSRAWQLLWLGWKALVAAITGQAVASATLGRTHIHQATLGWISASLLVSAGVFLWLNHASERWLAAAEARGRRPLLPCLFAQLLLLLPSLTIIAAAHFSDEWHHYFSTMLQPAPAVALLLAALAVGVALEAVARSDSGRKRVALLSTLTAYGRLGIPASLLLLGFLQGSSYLWMIGNDFTRYWAVADAISSMSGYPASRHMPVYIAAGMSPLSIELPFYPILLLISFTLFGHDTVGAQLPSLLANSLLPLLLYAFYRKADLGRPLAFAASCAVVSIPFFRLYTLNAPVPDAVFVAMLVATGYLFLCIIKGRGSESPRNRTRPAWTMWALFGVMAGLTAQTRPDGMLFGVLMLAALTPALLDRRFWAALGAFLASVTPFSVLMITTFGMIWPRNQGSSASLGNIAKNLDWLGRYSLRWFAEPLDLSQPAFVLIVAVLAAASAAGSLWLAVKRQRMAVLPLAGALQVGFVFTVDPRASGADQWFDFFRHVSYSLPFLLLPIFRLAKDLLEGIHRRWSNPANPGWGRQLVHLLAFALLLLAAYEIRLVAFPSASYHGLGRQFLTSDVWVSLPDIVQHRYALPELTFVKRDGILMYDVESRYMVRHTRSVISHFNPVASLSTGRGPGYQLSALFMMLFGAIFAFSGFSQRGTNPSVGEAGGEDRLRQIA